MCTGSRGKLSSCDIRVDILSAIAVFPFVSVFGWLYFNGIWVVLLSFLWLRYLLSVITVISGVAPMRMGIPTMPRPILT